MFFSRRSAHGYPVSDKNQI